MLEVLNSQRWGFAYWTSILHHQPLLYALTVILMPAVEAPDFFFVLVIALKMGNHEFVKNR